MLVAERGCSQHQQLTISRVQRIWTLSLSYAFGAIAVIASLLVIGQGNPMHSVMLLIVSFGALAGLYVLLDAPFTAVTQIIVYAGAIMVLFLFVVMLLNVPREEPAPATVSTLLGPIGMRIGALLSVLLGAEILWALGRVGHRLVHAGVVGDLGQLRGAHRQRDFHPSRVRVRSDLGPDSGAMIGAVVLARKEQSVMVPLNYYLVLSGVLFAIGTAGVFLRRNLITVLLSIEIMLNAVNLTFVAVGRYRGSVDGQIITFFVMTVAAAEAAVGLALIICALPSSRDAEP